MKKQKAELSDFLGRALFLGLFMLLVTAYSGRISFQLHSHTNHELADITYGSQVTAILPAGSLSFSLKKYAPDYSNKFNRLFLNEEQKLLPDNKKITHFLILANQEFYKIRPMAYNGFYYQRSHFSGDEPFPRS